MCWESKKLKVKTAKRDIPVWKVVYSDESSYETECYALYHRTYSYLKGDGSMHFRLELFDACCISYFVQIYNK